MDANFRVEDKTILLKEIYEMTKVQFKTVKYLMQNKDWDYFKFVIIGLDRFHHAFWKYYDKSHNKYELGNKFEGEMKKYYQYLDQEIGEILDLVGENTVTMIVSDHGAKAMKGLICINMALEKLGLLKFKSKPKPGIRMLDGLKDLGIDTKFYQASSSEMFGNASNEMQNEQTKFSPRSPYACSKVFAFHITRVYRKAYNMFASNGILFNHESPRRGENFVTRKITLSLARIKVGLQDKLFLGNLDAKRDWGYAKDFVEAMWLILQHNKPDDFVIATSDTHTVREFAEEAAKILDFDIEWQGQGIDEKGIDLNTGNSIIEISPRFYRPLDVNFLLGDPQRQKEN